MSLLERDRKLSREGKTKTEREKAGQRQKATARAPGCTGGIHQQVEPALPAGGRLRSSRRSAASMAAARSVPRRGRWDAGSRRWGGAAARRLPEAVTLLRLDGTHEDRAESQGRSREHGPTEANL